MQKNEPTPDPAHESHSGPAELRKALAERQMGQGALERAVGVSKGTATHWLSGAKRPDLDSAVAIERLLGVPARVWASKRARGEEAEAAEQAQKVAS
jgi:transcriptional regulator with XRE-family HTH domain